MSDSTHIARDTQSIFDLSAKHINAGKVKFYRDNGMEFVLGKREGSYIWDIEGETRLINCHVNGGTFNLGHRNAEVIAAVQQGLETLDIGNHHLMSGYRAELARQLADSAPGDIDTVIFGVSGGEAMDVAIKVARKATGRSGIVSADGGYHGHTGLAVAAGDAKFREPFGSSIPGFSQVPFNDIDALKQALGDDTAAVIFETIPATLGMPLPDEDYFAQVRELCDHNGTLFIADEVQTGLGRTGRFWGMEHYGVVPDIIVAGKGLSGGIYPITATLIRQPLARVFDDDPFAHISTFGGSELGCLAALKVLEISHNPAFLARVESLADRFSAGLGDVQQKHPMLLVQIRQLGLFVGLKTPDERLGPLLMKTCFDNGLFCVFSGNDTSVLQFLPVLTISDEVADEILERLDRACSDAEGIIMEHMARGDG